MDPITVFASSIAASMLANFGTKAVEKLFRTAVNYKPELQGAISTASTSYDIENIFKEAIGIINAHAGTGSIDIDQALLSAIRGARFDHAQGKVNIANSVVKAPVLITGGSMGATGQTIIGGNTSLKSRGTEIKVGGGASIKISGNASIKQS